MNSSLLNGILTLRNVDEIAKLAYYLPSTALITLHHSSVRAHLAYAYTYLTNLSILSN